MYQSGSTSLRRAIAMSLLLLPLGLSVGCATIFNGGPKRVTVEADPGSQTVYYEGVEVSPGERITVHNGFRTPEFIVESSDSRLATSVSYAPSGWLLGDAALFVFGAVPGVVALGIDIGTGNWRNIDDPQSVRGGSAVASAEGPEGGEKKSRWWHWDRKKDRKEDRNQAGAYPPEEGIASWYDEPQMTASGERFDPEAMTAAHKTLPLGTVVRVTRLDTNRSVVVTINDRGPYVEGRIIDLARKPARRLDLLDRGLAPCRVEIERLAGS